MPKAVIYKMSGDYAANVPVTLTADGRLHNYPAPTDIAASSTPVSLADGWWLDRRGVSQNTVFLRYTYDEYAALSATPSHEQLLNAIIPGARVTAVRQLQITPSQALADTASVNADIRRMRLNIQ